LLEKYNLGSGSHLIILGLKKIPTREDGEKTMVVVAVNGRPLTTCDVEHGCCITYYFYERKPGCTKGAATNPKLSFPHCHPIRTVQFENWAAAASIYQFVEEIEVGRWSTADSETTPSTAAAARTTTNRRALPVNKNPRVSKLKEMSSSSASSDDDDHRSGNNTSSSKSSDDSDDDFSNNDSSDYEPDRKRKCKRKRTKTESSFSWTEKRQASNKEETCGNDKEDMDSADKENEEGDDENDDILSCGVLPTSISLVCCMVFGVGDTLEEAKKQLGTKRLQLLRDTSRCLATETVSGTEVYSLDNEPSEMPRPTRHIEMSLNNINMEHPILKSLSGKVSQITLDWVWLLDVHTRQRLFDQFYSISLPAMAQLLVPQGAIYLPLCPSIFVNVVIVEGTLRSAGMQMSLMTESEAEEIFLFQGTEQVKSRYDLMNKEPDQLSNLGISDATLKQRADSEPRILPKVILERYHELAKQSLEVDGPHKFLKLLKVGDEDPPH
jgi:hypothetical protein